MTKEELLEKINNGEDSFTQFKESITRTETLTNELVAFSNSYGGVIIVGVSDDGEIIGLSKEEIGILNQLLSNVSNQNVKPAIYPLSEIKTIDNKKIVVITVFEGFDKPYATSSGFFYTKVGADKRKMSREELKRLFAHSGAFYADEEINKKSSIKDIDLQRFQTFFENKRGIEFEESGLKLEKVLENMGLLEKEHLTMAGILLFSKKPQKFYPTFTIKLVQIAGNSLATDTFIAKHIFEGDLKNLFDQIMQFFNVILQNIQVEDDFNTLGKREIPYKALAEIVVNALIHRDYYINSPIRIFIFNNRIEIKSPGKLPNSLTVEKIKNGLAVHRNPVLDSIAPFMLGYSGIGSGIERVISLCGNTVEFINNIDTEEFTTIFQRDLKL